MTPPKKCAHPACRCTVAENGQFGEYCSDRCREAKKMNELRCECGHPDCE